MFKRVLLLAGVLLLILIVAAAVLWINVNRMLLPVDAGAVDEFMEVTIAPGSGTVQIAAVLVEKGIIHNSAIFRIYARWHKLDALFIAGTYRLSPSMSLEQVAAKLTSGEVHRNTAWFTIPEGFTVEQIADRLAGKGLADRELFLELAKTPPESILEQFSFLQEINNEDIIYLLEGYLFPDTYEVEIGTCENELITMMLRRFDRSFTVEYRQRADELSMTIHEVATIASMIEKEAVVAHEQKKISSVIYNRLKVGMGLGIDATTQYAVGKTVLTQKDLDSDSPYNTRNLNHTGLTPGPIASFGDHALKAALYPLDTEYYYFNARYDGTGEHYFSRTLAEHERNQVKADRNRNN